VSKIAQKYGGNGHPNSSGFHVEADKPLPWKLVEHDVPTD
jgi:nanoRNase/pAp phosphatase (c-di-AMP/oligoRNAs hydrolase)